VNFYFKRGENFWRDLRTSTFIFSNIFKPSSTILCTHFSHTFIQTILRTETEKNQNKETVQERARKSINHGEERGNGGIGFEKKRGKMTM